MADSHALAVHGRRVTMWPQDIRLAIDIRRDPLLQGCPRDLPAKPEPRKRRAVEKDTCHLHFIGRSEHGRHERTYMGWPGPCVEGIYGYLVLLYHYSPAD